MKCFLLLLAIGLTASEKLDRTYLPPPGAQFSGGSPGDIQAPLEPPNILQHGSIQLGPNLNEPQDFGLKGKPGQVPVTTTSYAFTQTTTYPPIEGYETTVVPINPVTGLPVQNSGETNNFQRNSENVPGFVQNYGQTAPNYNTIQPGSNSQGLLSDGQSLNMGSPNYTPTGNQPLSQYPNQATIISSEGNNQSPKEAPQQPDIYRQYPGSQTTSPVSTEYSNQNGTPGTNNQIPGIESQIPGVGQGSTQYSQEGIVPGQQGKIMSTVSPQQITPSNLPGQYIEIGPKGPFLGEPPQGAYSGQPITVHDDDMPQPTQGYQGLQGQIGESGTRQPLSTAEQNMLRPGSILGQNIYQPTQDYNKASSTSFAPGSVSSTLAYSEAGPIIRPERPQAAGDRNAVILNYENVRTPNGYAYSYDTSNGIHADESGIVSDGTRAQGSYSYMGDDGKLYSVIYTADENGFQPRGDHIPTPPPIPEAIQRVIEQAERDKAAGIIDDGSYDEAKYGHMNYLPTNRHRPQIHGARNFINNQIDGLQRDTSIPTSEINGNEYDDNLVQNQLGDNSPKKPSGKHAIHHPSHKNTGEIDTADFNDNQNQVNKVVLGQPNFGEDNLSNVDKSYIGEKGFNKQPGTSDRKPIISGGVKTDNNLNNETPKIYEFDNGYGTDKNNPEYYNAGQNSAISNNNKPVFGLRKQKPKAKIEGKRPQTRPSLNQGNIDDFVSEREDAPSEQVFGQKNVNANPNQVNNQQIDENGYYYNPPQTQFSQAQFPTRFKDQDSSSTTKPMSYESFKKYTTIKPFQTPDAYSKPKGDDENREKYEEQQSTTLKPFMTSRVTTEANSYTDYDNEEDYATDPEYTENIDNEYTSSTIRPDKKNSLANRRPSQSKQRTSRPQYGQRTPATQKGTVAPSQKDVYYNTVQPDFNQGSSTTEPSQSSRFGSTKSPIQNQRRPATSRRPSISTAVGYPSTKVVSGYSPDKVQPDYESRVSYGQTGSTPQNYQSYTNTPTTIVPTVPGYQPSTGVFGPSEASKSYQPSPPGTYQAEQQYEPVRSEYTVTGKPQRPTSMSYKPVTYLPSAPGFGQNYQQRPMDGTVNTSEQLTSSRPGSFILSGSGTSTSQTPPTGSYQTGYQYGTTTPGYTTTITSSTGRPNVGLPTDTGSQGSYYSQPSHSGYEHSSSGPVYSTTQSPSTIGTTPGSFIASTTPGRPTQEYYTTQRPYPSTQGIYNQSPVVDGFGRPINYDQQSTYPATGQDANQYPSTMIVNGNNVRGPSGLISASDGLPSGDKSTDNLKPMYSGDQFANYPGYYGQPQVIGEDFSGPKQPQTFDPQTGYHY